MEYILQIDFFTIIREKNASFRRSRKPMNIALIPDDEMDNDILTSTAKRSGTDYFFDYVKNGGEALIRQKRHVTRAVRPTKRYENIFDINIFQVHQ